MDNGIIVVDKESITEAINILKICKKTLYMIDNKTFNDSEMVTVMISLDNVATDLEDIINEQATVEPTLYGYNLKHLDMIARVLQKEGLPPERVAEALTDIGRIVTIIKDEFEESLQKAITF